MKTGSNKVTITTKMILKNNMKYELRYFESHCNSTRSSKIKLALGKHLEIIVYGLKILYM